MSKLINLDSLNELDSKNLGLICGIEIHQQLNTGKLFCKCPSEIVPNEELTQEVSRKLRFSLSETGEIDKAAMGEFKKAKTNKYRFNSKNACLVDLDEEPPKGPNQKAFETAMGVAKMLDLNVFPKIQFMRKIIIDGSITSGFQRTALLGIGGSVEVNKKKISIDAMNLEEDSCRTIERHDDYTVFALDRQGIPLIEITTGPNIHTPEDAYETALHLGNVLRSFKYTKRGLGTIRQDLNVSIKGGARIEVKGTQNLKLIPQIIEDEMRRQKVHLSIIEEMNSRGSTCENFTDWEIFDVSKIFKKTKSKIIKENKSSVFAVKLFNFKGLLGHELQKGHRFGSEISDRNKKLFPMIKGLFHSDEDLSKYSISESEVKAIREELDLKKDDSFILIANEEDIAAESLKNVLLITQDLVTEVEEHVRQVDPKGTKTTFLRAMPGSARMYPETDIQDIESPDLEKIKLPELYQKKLDRISKNWKLDNSKIEEALSKFSEEQVEELIKISGKSAAALHEIIFDLPKDIKKRDNLEPTDLNYELLKDLLSESKENNFNSKIIRDIFVSLYKDKLTETNNLKKYLEDNNLIAEQIDEKEIEKKIKEIVEKHKGAPFGALMGIAMKEFQGNVDGKIISEILRKYQ